MLVLGGGQHGNLGTREALPHKKQRSLRRQKNLGGELISEGCRERMKDTCVTQPSLGEQKGHRPG